MKRNFFWISVLFLVGTPTVWFVSHVCGDLLHYYRLRHEVRIRVKEFDIREINNKFFIIAKYHYDFNGKQFQGEESFGGAYLNPYSAWDAQKKLALSQNLNGWLDPTHPELSTITKNFPMKKMISAIVLLGLTIYFLVLGCFVKVKYG